METREKLKRILKEWAEYPLPDLFKRNFDESLLATPEILSIIGARRSGKTWLCFQIIKNLRSSLARENTIYINFEDERLHPLKGDELTLLWEVILETFSVDLNKKVFLFVDEIQNVPHWSKWARRITEQNPNIKLILTGSSSKLLSREIATELRGRTLSFSLYPLSFEEFLRAKNDLNPKEADPYNSRTAPLFKKQFNEYLQRGGFPGVLFHPRPQDLLKEYFQVMFQRDLVERYKIKNVKLFEDYLTLMMDQVACHFSVSSTSQKLKGFGYSLSKNTLSNFLRYGEDVFLVFGVKKFSYRIKEQLRATQKIYAVDHGLVQAIRFAFSEDYGRMLENAVFLELRRKNPNIFYHGGEKECDFLVMDKKKIVQAIQVCRSLADPATRDREIQGLVEALDRSGLKEGFVLSEDHLENLEYGGKSIKVLPAWYWMLEKL